LLLLGGNLRSLRRCGSGTLAFRRGCGRLRRGVGSETTVPAIAEFAIASGTIGALIPLAAAIAALLLPVAAISMRPAIVAISVFTRTIPVIPLAAELAVATIIALTVAIMTVVIVTLIPIVPGTIVVAVLMIEIARLLLVRSFAARLLRLDAELIAVVFTGLIAVAVTRPGKRMSAGRTVIAERIHATLLRHLLAITQDDAIIMLGVLKIILSEHGVAGGQRITRQRNIFLGDMRWGATDLHVRTRALEAPHQGIL
jgi:hypothetical protein